MKKLLTLLAIAFISLQLISCKKEVKKEPKPKTITKNKDESIARFSLKNAKSTINFTAYKSTEKIPVKGTFVKVELTNGCEGNTVKDAINGAEFKIPINSLKTQDSSRDFKIQKFFFQVMENTTALTGRLMLNDDKNGEAEFTMNGVTKKLTFEYSINNQTFSMKTIMNINDWKGEKALASLNEACKYLHMGSDGKSKTWSEVAIDVTSVFK